jgi:hypothetical protein
MYGLPDSWALWGTKKVFRALTRSRGFSRQGVFGGGKPPRIGMQFALKNVTLYPDKMVQLLNLPNGGNGTLGKTLSHRAKVMHSMAKDKVGKKNGDLANSIYMRHYATKTGQSIRMGSYKKYALAHHEGTRPHLINSQQGKKLRFVSARSTVQYATVVRHPGTRANRFLYHPMKVVFSDIAAIRPMARAKQSLD